MIVLNVEVTKQDIERGEQKDAQKCPVARALKRAGLRNFIIGNLWIETDKVHSPILLRLPLPEDARTFIREFDGFNDVKPFSFKLRLKKGAIAAFRVKVN